MELREELTDFIYRFILTSCIAVFLFFEVFNFMDSELITGKNIISILLISLSFNALLLIYHKIRLYIIPAILLVIAIFAFAVDKEDISLILKSVLFKLLIIGLIAFVVFLTSDTSLAVNLILSGGLVIYMFILLIRDIGIYPASPALALFYIAFSCARLFRRNKDKNAARVRGYITYLFPFLLIIPLGVLLLPKPDSPISWNWAVRLYEMTVDKINEIAHELSLQFSSSDDDSTGIVFGYADSMIYDNSGDSDAAIMELTPESRLYGSCYLNGEIFNVFDDGEWHNTLDTSKDYSYIDSFETFYGMINFDSDSLNNVLKNTTLKVKYLDLTTKLLFSPAKIMPSYSRKNSSSANITSENEHIFFSERKTYGTEYVLDFFQINYGSAPFLDYMNSSLTDSEDVLQTVKSRYLRPDYSDIELEDLLEYRKYVYENYTSSPIVRDSVKNWVSEVTKGCSTDYEKLKAIEYALSMYEYNLENGELPDYVDTEGDYLDYFLLKARSGYCVHYATAFCLLARYMGFPSRVIQGYKAPTSSDKSITVMNSNGHAWPEVYFKGKGWITFEPTPGFDVERYHGWKIYSGKYSDFQEADYSYLQNQPEVPVTAEDEEYIKKRTEMRVSGMLILIIASVVICSLLLLVVVTVVANHVKRKRLSPEKLYMHEFKGIMAILKELKITRARDETLEEFSNKCVDILESITQQVLDNKNSDASKDSPVNEDINSLAKGNIESRFASVIKTYEKYLYGSLTLCDSDMNEISSIKDRLLLLLKRIYKTTYPIHKLKLYIASSVRG